MKQFQNELQAKAHLRRIQNAKTTLSNSKHRVSQNKSCQQNQVQIILHLYDIQEFQSIPLYKLLKPANLQQYTRELILRGYGVNIGRLTLLNQKQKQKLFEDIKVLPGHSVKINKIINSLKELTMANQSTYTTSSIPSSKNSKRSLAEEQDYQDQLSKVIDQYTVKENKPSTQFPKRQSSNILSSEKKDFKKQKSKQSFGTKLPNINKSDTFHRPNTEKKKSQVVRKDSSIRMSSKQKDVRSIDLSKTTIKIGAPVNRKLPPSSKNICTSQKKMVNKEPIDVNLHLDKVKCLFKSIDGGIMTSTIVNVDLEEVCFCIATYLQKLIRQPQKKQVKTYTQSSKEQLGDFSVQDVNDILRQSYLHPLYTANKASQFYNDEEVQQEIEQPQYQQQLTTNAEVLQSSFFGNSSVSFGLGSAIEIFQQTNPTQVDYYVPTVDSLSNFIKNITISAKMQRQVPVLSLLYIIKFLNKSNLQLTSLNYKRLVISCMLLASKVWDDESFQTPSFSHTFPEYSTVLLNQLEKQILISINYQLKLNKKQYALLYYQIRQYRKSNAKSFQNRLLTVKRVLELQKGISKQYRSDNFRKRKSF